MSETQSIQSTQKGAPYLIICQLQEQVSEDSLAWPLQDPLLQRMKQIQVLLDKVAQGARKEA